MTHYVANFTVTVRIQEPERLKNQDKYLMNQSTNLLDTSQF
jgi:hypothetical protein